MASIINVGHEFNQRWIHGSHMPTLTLMSYKKSNLNAVISDVL